MIHDKARQGANHRQLQSFAGQFPAERDDLGRLIFAADVQIETGLGTVTDRSRVMLTEVTGDTGEVVVFKTRVLDIGLYILDFTAAFQTFTHVDGRFLRIEGIGSRTGSFICKIYPVA